MTEQPAAYVGVQRPADSRINAVLMLDANAAVSLDDSRFEVPPVLAGGTLDTL
jgi:hypothetical protein